ncbi:MAG: galactokinase family protein [Gemmatimonadota bacterium]
MTGLVFVPGRIEVLGKHTDYAGGDSLLVATEQGFTFRSEAVPGAALVVRAAETGEEVRYRLRAVAEPGARTTGVTARSEVGGAGPSWARYVEAVAGRLLAEFGDGLQGARVVFESDLPVGAGLSSSSALITGLFLAWDRVCRVSARDDFRATVPDRCALAAWLASVERGDAVGTRGGAEDHTAILRARAGHVVRYAFDPVRFRGEAPVPDGWVFAVGASGVVAEKSGAVREAYNGLSDDAARAARAWSAGAGAVTPAPHLGDALEASRGDGGALLRAIADGARALGLDPDALTRRARHFMEETSLVDDAFRALAAGDIQTFASAANRSAERGAELLGNQVPETLALTALARDLGAPAASPFGAGFGGAVWALVRHARAEPFLAAWEERYRARYPDRSHATFFRTRAAAPARPVP